MSFLSPVKPTGLVIPDITIDGEEPTLSTPSTFREPAAEPAATTASRKRKADSPAREEDREDGYGSGTPSPSRFRPRGLSIDVSSISDGDDGEEAREVFKAKRRKIAPKEEPNPIMVARERYSAALKQYYGALFPAQNPEESEVVVVKRAVNERMTNLMARVKEAIAAQDDETGVGLQPMDKETLNYVFKVNAYNSTTQKVETIAIFKPGGRGSMANEAADIETSKDGIRREDEVRNEAIVAGIQDLSLTTMYVRLSPTTQGMLQEFVPGAKNFNQLSNEERSQLIAAYPLRNFQKMAIMDLQFLNTDRNRGNLLHSQQGNNHMIHCIDHALILPRGFESQGVFYWATWAMAHRAFTTESLAEIAGLNFQQDAAAILAKFPAYSLESIETMDFCYHLLKEGAQRGLTPFQLSFFLMGRPQSFLGALYQLAQIAFPGDPAKINRCVKAEINKAIAKMVSIYPQAVENAKKASDDSSSDSDTAGDVASPVKLLTEISKLMTRASAEQLRAAYS